MADKHTPEKLAQRRYEASMCAMGDLAASRYPTWDQLSAAERKTFIDDAISRTRGEGGE